MRRPRPGSVRLARMRPLPGTHAWRRARVLCVGNVGMQEGRLVGSARPTRLGCFLRYKQQGGVFSRTPGKGTGLCFEGWAEEDGLAAAPPAARAALSLVL